MPQGAGAVDVDACEVPLEVLLGAGAVDADACEVTLEVLSLVDGALRAVLLNGDGAEWTAPLIASPETDAFSFANACFILIDPPGEHCGSSPGSPAVKCPSLTFCASQTCETNLLPAECARHPNAVKESRVIVVHSTKCAPVKCRTELKACSLDSACRIMPVYR